MKAKILDCQELGISRMGKKVESLKCAFEQLLHATMLPTTVSTTLPKEELSEKALLHRNSKQSDAALAS